MKQFDFEAIFNYYSDEACKPLKGFAGSNPALSAVRTVSFIFLPFLFSYIHR